MRVAIVFLLAVIGVSSATAQKNDWEATASRADGLMESEQFEKALPLYSEAIKQSKLVSPESTTLLYKRAVCYYRLEKFQEALHDISAFIEKNATADRARLLRAFINRELDDTESQITDLTALLQNDPSNADYLKWKASLLIEKDAYDEARALLNQISSDNNDPEAELYRGLADYYQQKPDSAIFHFDQAIAMAPDYIAPYYYASSLALDQEAYDLALDYIAKAQKLSPDDLTLYFYKGIALAEKDQLDEGCSCLAKAFYGGIDDAGEYLSSYCYESED